VAIVLVDLVLRITFALLVSCTVRFFALFLRFVNFLENRIKINFYLFVSL
jgi:hypothetical protein